MAQGGRRVFERTVDDLLKTVSEDDVGDDYFSGRTFAFRTEAARMQPTLGDVEEDGTAEFKTVNRGTVLSIKRQSLMEATLGVLLERQATWGPLFNHPRTLVIGPAASFQCLKSKLGQVLENEWNVEPALENDNNTRVFGKDIDQIVWVNLCPDDFGGLLNRNAAFSLVEIGVARFRHEKREGSKALITVGGARFYSGEGKREQQSYKPMEKRFEMNQLMDILLEEDEGEEEEEDMGEEDTETEDTETETESEAEPEDAEHEYYGTGKKGDVSHIKAAAVVLERVMRDRTTDLTSLLTYMSKDDKADKATRKKIARHTDSVYKAVISGQMPYANDDLSEDTRQPGVMPGEFTIDRIADVLEHVVIGTKLPSKKKKKKKSSRRQTDASFSNPYETFAVVESKDADALSPLSGSDIENFL